MRMVLKVLIYAVGSLEDSDDLGLEDRDLRTQILIIGIAGEFGIWDIVDSQPQASVTMRVFRAIRIAV